MTTAPPLPWDSSPAATVKCSSTIQYPPLSSAPEKNDNGHPVLVLLLSHPRPRLDILEAHEVRTGIECSKPGLVGEQDRSLVAVFSWTGLCFFQAEIGKISMWARNEMVIKSTHRRTRDSFILMPPGIRRALLKKGRERPPSHKSSPVLGGRCSCTTITSWVRASFNPWQTMLPIHQFRGHKSRLLPTSQVQESRGCLWIEERIFRRKSSKGQCVR